MSSVAISPSSPISSTEMPLVDLDRNAEVTRRHALLIEYLRLKGLDGLLLREPANFAWLTCGADNTRRGGWEPVAAIFVTSEARVILCNNVDSGQIFDRDLMGLGFLLKERPWTENLEVLRQDCCRGRKIASDNGFPGTENVGADLRPFRMTLTPREHVQLRSLGRELAHAIEATCRNFERGESEAEIAGQLAHRLLKHQIQPVRLQVMADAQSWRYRHWSHGADRVERQCVISAMGRRHGLHLAATRTVCLGEPSQELYDVHRLSTVVQATGIYFTQPGWSMEETWKRVLRIYEKFGVPDEWRCAEQAEVLGYHPAEMPLIPGSADAFQRNTVVFWHPSVRSSQVGDSILLRDDGNEVLTPSSNWPQLTIKIKGEDVDRPGILIREVV